MSRTASSHEADTGRMIALMGDAELDEGNVYECLIEGYKHEVRNCWWIVDYNRQSLDATTADRMFRRFDDIFETCGWRVVTLEARQAAEGGVRAAGRQGVRGVDRHLPQCRVRSTHLSGRRGLARSGYSPTSAASAASGRSSTSMTTTRSRGL